VCEHPDSLITNIVTLSGISISSWKNPALAEKQFFNDNVNLNDNLNFLGLSIIEVEQKERFFCEAGFFFLRFVITTVMW